ncbi:uncharacterized protein A4U43_C02F3160 [Asparagus officinalis]|uniref:Uncharacterized protein n=1 Tax=Asparagus officinalis TaxID=4686 RepID=A0A5P1FFF7_ASPOF|nr:uncharacterized protein A4U43_C02F3160 [Asparagus officinalis]
MTSTSFRQDQGPLPRAAPLAVPSAASPPPAPCPRGLPPEAWGRAEGPQVRPPGATPGPERGSPRRRRPCGERLRRPAPSNLPQGGQESQATAEGYPTRRRTTREYYPSNNNPWLPPPPALAPRSASGSGARPTSSAAFGCRLDW